MYIIEEMTTESSTESSTSSHLSAVMTTTGVAQITSSSPRVIEYYFQCAALVIGCVGTAANALIV